MLELQLIEPTTGIIAPLAMIPTSSLGKPGIFLTAGGIEFNVEV